jgi:hypothetical protein
MDQAWKRRLPAALAAAVDAMESLYRCTTTVVRSPDRSVAAHLEIRPEIGIRIGHPGETLNERDLAHEIIHARRNLIEQVPRLVPANRGRFAAWVTIFENDLEHLFVIPEERSLFADAPAVWEERYRRLLGGIGADGEAFARRFDLLRHALVIGEILPDSLLQVELQALLEAHGLAEEAAVFRRRMAAARGDKRALITASVTTFPFLRGSARIERFTPVETGIGAASESLERR